VLFSIGIVFRSPFTYQYSGLFLFHPENRPFEAKYRILKLIKICKRTTPSTLALLYARIVNFLEDAILGQL